MPLTYTRDVLLLDLNAKTVEMKIHFFPLFYKGVVFLGCIIFILHYN